MRYENIYSSFPCPASGHFSAASSRVGHFSAASSRVGKILRLLHTTFCHARATRQNGYATRTSRLRGSGFAIRATENPLSHYPHNIPHKHIYTTLLTVQTSADRRANKCRQTCRQNQPLPTLPNYMIFIHLKAKVQSADKMTSKCRCARVRVREETSLMQFLTTTFTNFVLYVL